jgi:hypothetical protein
MMVSKLNSKIQKEPKLNKVPAAKTSPASKSAAPEVCVTHDKIRDRAFQIYESRGRQHGLDAQDWFRAELQIAERQILSL